MTGRKGNNKIKVWPDHIDYKENIAVTISPAEGTAGRISIRVKLIIYGIGKHETFLTTETSQGRVLSAPTLLVREVSGSFWST